jgi:hypothetical protein
MKKLEMNQMEMMQGGGFFKFLGCVFGGQAILGGLALVATGAGASGGIGLFSGGIALVNKWC